MKFTAHARYREDTGELVVSELTDEHDLSPTLRMWVNGVKLRTANPFEYMSIDGMRPVHDVAQGLTKALCILIGSGLTPKQLEALREGVPELTIRQNN